MPCDSLEFFSRCDGGGGEWMLFLKPWRNNIMCSLCALWKTNRCYATRAEKDCAVVSLNFCLKKVSLASKKAGAFLEVLKRLQQMTENEIIKEKFLSWHNKSTFLCRTYFSSDARIIAEISGARAVGCFSSPKLLLPSFTNWQKLGNNLDFFPSKWIILGDLVIWTWPI